MKNITITTFILCLFTLMSKGQSRYTDMKVEAISPPDGTTIYGPTKVGITYKLTNQGPDSLWQGDTFAYRLYNYYSSGPREVFRYRINNTIPPDSFIILTDSVLVQYTKSTPSLPVKLIASGCYSHDEKRPLFIETDPDREDNSFQILFDYIYVLSVDEPNHQTVPSPYPNPVFGKYLYIRTDGQPIRQLSIFSLDGKGISNINLEDNRINIENLENGIYFLKYELLGNFYNHKIIVNH